jgi:uncharacterized protein with ParB-like and HNH nuclease domain
MSKEKDAPQDVNIDASKWYEEYDEDIAGDYPIGEYELTASPNDFNIKTIFDFIESGIVVIPGFQRNYVWDQKRASKLIESLIIGLPVPQLFFYEQSKNQFWVIDGQQRLMSIYYFIKGRFPRDERRVQLRRIFSERNIIPENILSDDDYFAKFNLKLPSSLPNTPNKFNSLNYQTLGEHKTQFELRTIRSIMVKQISPPDDDSAMYELFNRLNSGGMNLSSQEIRVSLYHSDFFEMLSEINLNSQWRYFLKNPEPDLHMKDIEFLLRAFAFLLEGKTYNPSMVKFLNGFSKRARQISPEGTTYFKNFFEKFMIACSHLPEDAFQSNANRFSVTIFESVFTTIGESLILDKQLPEGEVNSVSLESLKKDPEFLNASQKRTADTISVKTRLDRARALILIDNG